MKIDTSLFEEFGVILENQQKILEKQQSLLKDCKEVADALERKSYNNELSEDVVSLKHTLNEESIKATIRTLMNREVIKIETVYCDKICTLGPIKDN